ncbi:MAG: glycine cleavage system protein GcvH [Bacillota bacterium]|nr:glycine cleavage system protein GcvH [Bacillota bacterium]
MSGDFLEATYDKFIFRVKKDYLYHPEECWAKEEAGLVTVGVTDFLQKSAGDVAFLELPEAGTEVARGGEAGIIETIKTTITLIAPVAGVIKEVNVALEDNPELVNADPYGEGWLFKVVAADWEADRRELMDAGTYFPLMKEKIEREVEKK